MKPVLEPLFIRGRPETFGNKKTEEPWKKNISNQIKENWRNDGHVAERLQIDLKFFIQNRRETDLDNLIKPCIDGIGSILFEQRKGGIASVWNTEDKWVYKIIAEKIPVEDKNDEGVEITIRKYA